MLSFLRRVFGRAGQEPVTDADERAPEPALEPEPGPVDETPSRSPAATCPYCAYTLDPPPERSRRCPSCRQPIVVRHPDGRTVLLVESAVPIFDRERQRIIDEQTWTAQRIHWLALADGVRVPEARRARLAEADLSAAMVEACRALYLSAAEAIVRAARGSRRWSEVAKIRRHEAAALFATAGSPIPPPEEIVEFHRDGMLAELRALALDYSHAELVSTGCCKTCRADDGRSFKIAAELREPRLPHEGCPKGLCACEWWLAMPVPKKRRRTARPKPSPAVTEPEQAPVADAAPGHAAGPDA